MRIMEYETAGDPVSGLKWTRKTTRKISRELAACGLRVSPNSVARLLRSKGFSLRVNHKKVSRGSPPERDRQFRHIQAIRRAFEKEGLPVISVDTKKKELVGLFKNPGTAWAQSPTHVNDHDFRSDALGMAVPYGILDLTANRGCVFVGNSHDTPAFAVGSVARWWATFGRRRYRGASRLLILADTGGSNGSRVRAWKWELQYQVCDRFGLEVLVCHYPPGASKWNPIEHRLFSEISKNWAGRPLDTYETIVNYIRTTSTETGLRVSARLLHGDYPIGQRVSKSDMKLLNLEHDPTLPQWNYTIRPSGSALRSCS
jgi:hypothetical protein